MTIINVIAYIKVAIVAAIQGILNALLLFFSMKLLTIRTCLSIEYIKNSIRINIIIKRPDGKIRHNTNAIKVANNSINAQRPKHDSADAALSQYILHNCKKASIQARSTNIE